MHSRNLTWLLLTVVVAAAFFSCGEEAIQYPEGGFAYPAHYSDADTTFYTYPLKKFYSRRDSFRASQNYFFFRYLHEPNLSLKPLGEDYFRLEYGEAIGRTYCITLTPKLIVIKQPATEYNDYLDTAVDDVRRVFYDGTNDRFYEKYIHSNKYLIYLMQEWFPFDTAGRSLHHKHFIDSLLKAHPLLNNAGYCLTLLNKKMQPTFVMKYKSDTVNITRKQFKSIAASINQSGYWKMPYHLRCDDPPTDGWGFSLEANTSQKYNYVSLGSCSDDTKEQLAFCKACQQIINYAGLGKKISLYYSDSSEMGPIGTTTPDTAMQTTRH